MDINNFVSTQIFQNPLLISAIMAAIYNVIGYLYNCAEAKKWLPYTKSDLAVTLGLFESVFIILMGLGGLSPDLTAIIALMLNSARAFRQELIGKVAILVTTKTQTVTTSSTTEAAQGATVKIRNATWLSEDAKQQMWKQLMPTATYEVFLDTWNVTQLK